MAELTPWTERHPVRCIKMKEIFGCTVAARLLLQTIVTAMGSFGGFTESETLSFAGTARKAAQKVGMIVFPRPNQRKVERPSPED